MKISYPVINAYFLPVSILLAGRVPLRDICIKIMQKYGDIENLRVTFISDCAETADAEELEQRDEVIVKMHHTGFMRYYRLRALTALENTFMVPGEY